MTKSNDHAWVWAALEGLVDLTAQHDEAVTEAERLSGRVTEEMTRIHDATGLSRERLGEMVEGMRVIGSPVGTGQSLADSLAPCPPTDASADDALSIPAFLRRGETSGEDGRAKLVHDADAVARGSAP